MQQRISRKSCSVYSFLNLRREAILALTWHGLVIDHLAHRTPVQYNGVELGAGIRIRVSNTRAEHRIGNEY